MSAIIRSLVTAERSARAARTIAPRFIDEHGSLANSLDATRICSPAEKKIIITGKTPTIPKHEL